MNYSTSEFEGENEEKQEKTEMYFHGLKFTSLKFSEDKKWECDADSIHWISETEKTFLCIVYFENLKKRRCFQVYGLQEGGWTGVLIFYTQTLTILFQKLNSTY